MNNLNNATKPILLNRMAVQRLPNNTKLNEQPGGPREIVRKVQRCFHAHERVKRSGY